MCKCEICGEPVILRPSATERAKRYGGKPADYTALFRSHAACVVAKRSAESVKLMESRP